MKFTFYWKTGDREVYEGTDVRDAFVNGGCYAPAALGAVDFYQTGDDHNWKWNKDTKSWDKIPENAV